jgi:hypothetical protein
MTNKRDNEEEHKVRIEHVLARLAENRVDPDVIAKDTQRILDQLYEVKEHRKRIVQSVDSLLDRKPASRKREQRQKSR